MRTVLVIDDNPAVAQALSLLFGLHDIRTLTAFTPQKGLAALARERVDLVIADMNFSADTTSGEEGAALFRALRAQQPDLPVILLTAWTHLESAVQLVKAGAADYIGKPWDNDKLLATVENLLELAETTRERRRLQEEQRRRRERLAEQYDLVRHCVRLGCDGARGRACLPRGPRRCARARSRGPNGAGKERIAQIVHANSALRAGPFVARQLRRHSRRADRGGTVRRRGRRLHRATRARTGRFEAANGGTLFLDEIGDLPLAGQVKLLRVLETGQFEMLGSSKTRTAQVRIVSATNADLPALIREGRFREDLYYRLNVIDIAVPPLAERPADILPLARHFLGEGMQLSEDAAAALLAHDWPGNVRELRNSIERAKLLARDSASSSAADLNLPAATRGPAPARNASNFEQAKCSEASLAGSRRQHQPRGAEPGAVASGLVPPAWSGSTCVRLSGA